MAGQGPRARRRRRLSRDARMMAPSASPNQVGAAEFVRPEHIPTISQRVFLDQVRVHVPNIMTDLEETTRPVMCRHSTSKDTRDLAAALRGDKRARRRVAASQAAGRAAVIHSTTMSSAVGPWAERWHLDQPWVVSVAALTIGTWAERPDSEIARERRWAWGKVTPAEQQAWPRLSWNPIAQDLQTFRERVQAYIKKVEDLATRRGYVAPPYRQIERPARWTALYHVGDWSFARIAKDEKVERQSVAEAVKAFAAEIGLPLRPGRVGRPPTRK